MFSQYYLHYLYYALSLHATCVDEIAAVVWSDAHGPAKTVHLKAAILDPTPNSALRNLKIAGKLFDRPPSFYVGVFYFRIMGQFIHPCSLGIFRMLREPPGGRVGSPML